MMMNQQKIDSKENDSNNNNNNNTTTTTTKSSLYQMNSPTDPSDRKSSFNPNEVNDKLKDAGESPDEDKRIKESKTVNPAYQVKLERVLGLTVPSNSALDCDPNNGIVAYPAGCTVVLLNARKNRQSHVQNASRKTVTCVTFSSCGRFLATGECGHMPSVRVWDLSDKSQMAEFSGHKYGVSCVAFSPTQKYVVSVGSQHDMIVNVWDWRAGVKVASNKFSSKVKAVSFAENGSYFVTVGNRHVKFWYLDVARGHKFKEPVPLTGRSAILGEQRNNYFCDVACGKGEMGDSTFAITKSGLLCEFNNRRLLDKWVELRTPCANCVVAGEEYIFVGCAEGIIRCFSPYNLQFITTLPRTHYLGVDVSKGLNISHMASHPNNAKYPDTIAITLDEANHKVTAVYNDHSLYVWDVRDIKRVGKSHSYLYHSACIWGVEVYPRSEEMEKNLLPEGSFITCSSDDTMRIWNIDPNMSTSSVYKKNIYSQDLLKIIYVDSDMTFIKDTDISPQGNADKTDGSYDSRNGVRCIKVSCDGKQLASGDRAGNIRIHDLQYNEEVCKIEAHDAEVLCLEYSKANTGHKLLSSASRDRLIHVFNVDQDYSFVQTLDDHSSAITSVRFYQSQGNLQMVSCGADRSIIFRSATQNPQNEVFFSRGHNVAGKTTLYDMEVDHGQRHILTACQDRNIRVYNVNSGKHSKTFKGSAGDDGTLIKVVLDQSGIYAATSCTDKSICIYDYYSGECMATMFGHSEIVTGLRFSNDGKHLITVSGDGCVFIWSMPRDMTQIILARLAQQAERAERNQRESRKISNNSGQRIQTLDNEVFRSASEDSFNRNTLEDVEEPDYRFNVGQLPLWAKKQINDSRPKPPGSPSNNGGVTMDMPKGRWAQRLPNNPITFKSHYDTDSMVPYPSIDKRIDSESSKESSLEDNLQKQIPPQPPPRKNSNKQVISNKDFILSPPPPPPHENHHEITLGEDAFQKPGIHKGLSKRLGYPLTDDSDVSSLRVDDLTTDHDGDIEDYCEHDDESTEHSENTMYYPASQDTTNDFTVNAMDVEELRKSQRRHRKSRPERPTDIPLTSISGSQDSDDDEEVSTPSGEAAERNIMSMLSVSIENVDKLGRRETFLKKNFESLEGDSSRLSKETKNKNSISYKFNSRNRDVTNSDKRQELLKRIEETRMKLKSIGYKSTLRSSKSISDLCNIPEKDSSYMGSHQGNDHPPITPGAPFVLTLPPILAPHFSENLSSPLDGLKTLTVETSVTAGSILSCNRLKDTRENDNLIGGAIFEETSVPFGQQQTGRKLLLQLEKDLKDFEMLLYGEMRPRSPPVLDTNTQRSPIGEVEADSLEEKLLSLRMKDESEEDTTTVKSEESVFSCDSLNQDETDDAYDDDGDDGNDDERTKARDRGLLRLSRLTFSSMTLPSRIKKPFRFDRQISSAHIFRGASPPSFVAHPTPSYRSRRHKKVFRASSDSALGPPISRGEKSIHHGNTFPSDSSDVATPTNNPPFFTVRSPSQPNPPSRLPGPGTLPIPNPITPLFRSVNTGGLTSSAAANRRRFFLDQASVSLDSSPVGRCHEPIIRGGNLKDYPVIQAQPLPPGPPPSAYLHTSQGGLAAPGRAHRVPLAKRIHVHQVLPSKCRFSESLA